MVTGGCCCFGPRAQIGRRPEERGELAFLKSLRGSAKFLHKDPPTPLGAHAPPAAPTAPSGRRPRSWLAPTGSRLPRCQGHPTQTAARRRPGPPPAGAGRAGALGTPTGWVPETAAEARSPGLMTVALPRLPPAGGSSFTPQVCFSVTLPARLSWAEAHGGREHRTCRFVACCRRWLPGGKGCLPRCRRARACSVAAGQRGDCENAGPPALPLSSDPREGQPGNSGS